MTNWSFLPNMTLCPKLWLLGPLCRVDKDGRGKIRNYYAEPLTDLSNSFHGTNNGERPLSLHLMNIQGIISKRRNKTEMMGKILQLDQPGKICLVTETHLDKKNSFKLRDA